MAPVVTPVIHMYMFLRSCRFNDYTDEREKCASKLFPLRALVYAVASLSNRPGPASVDLHTQNETACENENEKATACGLFIPL